MRSRLPILLAALVLGSAPSLAQERIWTLDQTDAEVYMVFGVPETDDVGVSFWCTIGSRKLKIFVPDGSADLAPNITAPFIVKIDELTFTLPGRTSANEMSGETSIETELSTDDPVIKALETADHFSVTAARHTTVFPLADANLAGLLSLCFGEPEFRFMLT